MSTLALELEDGRTKYRPGDVVRFLARWDLDQSPPFMEARLFWHTSGRGRHSLRLIDSLVFERPPRRDERRCELTLPDSPYSFSGKLISLQWTIELVVEGSKAFQRVDLTVSPTGEAIRLGPRP